MGDLAEELAEALPGPRPEVQVGDLPGGGTRVVVLWKDGSQFKVDIVGNRLEWKDLTAAKPKGGLYSKLIEITPPFFKARGVTHYLMTPGSDEAERRLLRRGNWEPEQYDVGGSLVQGYRWNL